MSSLARTLLAVALVTAVPALAADPPAPTPKQVTLEFNGKLRDGLKQLAAQGGINLIATGNLDDEAQIHLQGVSAEEALSTVAEAYHLRVHRKGTLWTLRPMTATERAEAEAGPPPSPAPVPAAPPMPEAAPVPPTVPSAVEQAERDVREQAYGHGRGKSDLVGTGALVVEDGQVVGDAVTYGGPLTVKGTVRGDAVAFGGGVHLGPKAVVEGDVVAFAGGVTKEEGAQIRGDEVAFGGSLGAAIARGVRSSKSKGESGPTEDPEDREARAEHHVRRNADLPGFFVRFAVLFGLGFLIIMFAPARLKLIETELKTDPVKCGLTGLVGALALIPLTLLLLVTVIGIPVAMLLWLLVGLGVVMGMIAVASEVGLRLPLLRNKKTQAVVLALGLLAMLLVAQIPVLGPAAMSLVTLVGLGAVIRTRFGQRPKGFPEPDRMPPEPTAAA